MGHLFLVNASFELKDVPEEHRDKLFRDFCEAVDKACSAKDLFYGTNDLHTANFSYGTFFYDFLYQEWSVINSKPTLKGISSTSLSLYQAIVYAMPSLMRPLASKNAFMETHGNSHYGFSGFTAEVDDTPYISCYHSWIEWKQAWFQEHQNEIQWQGIMDNFLPNKKFSDAILWEEVVKHGKKDEITKYNGNKTLTFYEEVMRKKGPDTEAYTIEIGTKIAEANYYKLLPQLSKNERQAAGNSLRTIFKLVGRNGERQFISQDHRHGMFEYHDLNGEHLGEYKFDGSYNADADSTHNLKTLREKGE